MRYIFQQSKIWEAGDPVDPSSPRVVVKVKPGDDGERRARRKLPPAPLGRRWLLVEEISS